MANYYQTVPGEHHLVVGEEGVTEDDGCSWLLDDNNSHGTIPQIDETMLMWNDMGMFILCILSFLSLMFYDMGISAVSLGQGS